MREVMVKIGLKQEEEEEGVVTEALLDSGVMGLVMSKEFARRHKFKRTKLERPVYVRNIDGTLNYVGPIVDIVEVEIFSRNIRVNRCDWRSEVECDIMYALARTP